MFLKAGNLLSTFREVVRREVLRKSLHTSAGRRKALENWKRPSVDDLGVPKDCHVQVFNKNQKKYNLHLLAGVGFFGFSTVVAVNTVDLNGTPAYLKESKFETIIPDLVALATAESARIAAEEVEAIEIARIAEKASIIAEAVAAEAFRITEEEAVAAKIATEEAAAAKIAAEEAEAAQLAAEVAEAVKIAAEVAEAAKIVADEAEAAKIAEDEAANVEAERIAAEEAVAAKRAAEEAAAIVIALERATTEEAAAEKAASTEADTVIILAGPDGIAEASKPSPDM